MPEQLADDELREFMELARNPQVDRRVGGRWRAARGENDGGRRFAINSSFDAGTVPGFWASRLKG
jgi:hypothetical protein